MHPAFLPLHASTLQFSFWLVCKLLPISQALFPLFGCGVPQLVEHEANPCWLTQHNCPERHPASFEHVKQSSVPSTMLFPHAELPAFFVIVISLSLLFWKLSTLAWK